MGPAPRPSRTLAAGDVTDSDEPGFFAFLLDAEAALAAQHADGPHILVVRDNMTTVALGPFATAAEAFVTAEQRMRRYDELADAEGVMTDVREGARPSFEALPLLTPCF